MPVIPIVVRCPRCVERIELTVTASVILTQSQPGRKCFITTQVSSSGIEHTCPDPRET